MLQCENIENSGRFNLESHFDHLTQHGTVQYSTVHYSTTPPKVYGNVNVFRLQKNIPQATASAGVGGMRKPY